MSADLAATQRALARLCTERSLCERFASRPEEAALELGLDIPAAQAWASTCGEDLRRFSNSLRLKRCTEAARHLPRTVKGMGLEFRWMFLAYAETPPPPVVNKPLADALAFVAFLQRETRAGRSPAGWIAELARYEAAWLHVSMKARSFAARQFRFRLAGWRRSAAAPAPPRAGLCLAIWWRLPGTDKIWHWIV